MTRSLSRVASNWTRTVHSGRSCVRRPIGVSVRRPPPIGQSIKLQRRAGESVTVSRPNGFARDDDARLERQFCQIVGGVISPLLANIYLHYGFDLWVRQW